MEPTDTLRGFQICEFQDSYGRPCTLQQSSAIGDYDDAFDRPGSSFVWLGKGPERMHLAREQVDDLVEALQRWRDTGGFEPPGVDEKGGDALP